MSSSSELSDPTLIIDPITEERASRTLYRIELLRRIREQVLPHPLLSERLKLCQPSPDLPEWWECGRHDRDLLLGASKHGVSRTDYHILNDPSLSFLEAQQRGTSQRGSSFTVGAQGDVTKSVMEGTTGPLLSPAELASAVAAANMALQVLKEEDGKDEGKAETKVKMETEANSDIPYTKTETEQTETEKEVKVEKDKTTTSEVKAEQEVEEMETSEVKDEQTKGDKSSSTDDKELCDEKTSAEALRDQNEASTELKEQPASSPKAQSDLKMADEDNAETQGHPKSPKSPKSADPDKSPLDDEEEERMDEDDKSEKSSQAEGKTDKNVWLKCLYLATLTIRPFHF